MEEHPTTELSPESKELLERGDLDELTRHVNTLVSEHSWEELVVLGRLCRLAFARGKQLWPVTAHVEYRLALEAPAPWAALMLETGSGRFTLGPLAEVAASTHSWAELSPHLHATPQAAMAAHERVVRGDDLVNDPIASKLPEVLDLPLRLEPWEPPYALAEYHPDWMAASSPGLPSLRALPLGARRPADGAGSEPADARTDEACNALEDLASTWTEGSNGRAQAVSATGNALAAIAALGARARELVELTPSTAVAIMAWAAAGGGAHGRRRGAAPGRFGAWWALAALGGLTDNWPVAPDHLGEVLHQLRWYAWGGGEPATGWALRIAVEAEAGPRKGRAWAITATDAA